MLQTENKNNIPVSAILKGSIYVIITISLAMVLLGVLTEMGWTGTVNWAGLYPVIIYLSVVAGAVIAGLKSGRSGWITGIGVGIVSSLFILALAFLTGDGINWPVFLVKTLINSFIGAFGGILGVNFSNDN